MPRFAPLPAVSAVLLVLAACEAPSLVLPPPPGTPVVTNIAPAAAFAGEWIAVSGSAFDPDPRANEVVFAGGTAATAEEVTAGGALRLRVPDDATSGPLAVRTHAGLSAPFGAFTFRGRGHPDRGTLASLTPAGLGPADFVVVGSEIFIVSTTLNAVVTSTGRRIDFADQPPAALEVIPNTTRIVAGIGDELAFLDAASGELLPGRVPMGMRVLEVLVVERNGRTVGLVLGSTDSGRSALAEVDFGADKPAAGPPRTIALNSVWNVATSSDGRQVVVAGRTELPDEDKPGRTTVGYAIWGVRQDDGGATEWSVPLPDGAVLAGAMALVDERAYVFFQDRTIGVLDLAAQTPRWLASRRPMAGPLPAGLAPVRWGDQPALLAVFPTTSQVAALALDGRPLWGVDVGAGASGLFVDARQNLAFVTDSADDDVHVVDLAQARAVGRISFEMGLGDDGGGWQGLAFDGDRLLAVAQRWRALVSLDVETAEPAAAVLLSADSTVPRAVARAPDGTVWVLHERELGRLTGPDGPERIVVSNLPARGKWLAFTDDGGVVVGMLDRFALWREQYGLRVPVVVPGLIDLLEVGPDGSLLVAWTEENADGWDVAGVARWTREGLESGGAPAVAMPALGPPYSPLGIVRAPAGLMLFFGRAGPDDVSPVAITLSDSLQPSAPTASAMRKFGPVAMTPDGRRLFWADAAPPAGVLQYARVEGDGRVVALASQPLDGNIRGIAVDRRGDHAFVLLGGSNRIAVIQ